MRNSIGRTLIILGALCIIAAVGLYGYNKWDDRRAGNAVTDVQDALEDAIGAQDSIGAAALSGDESSELTSVPAWYLLISDDDEAREMATVEVDGYDYIGTLSIPSYGLELPIMSEWSYSGLRIAPGRFSGSVWSNDMVICGHNYERHFGNLKNLEAGEEVTFTDVEGNVFNYEVKEDVIRQPTDVEEMTVREDGEWDLTLYTCTVGGRTRVTVRCIRTE